MPGSAIYAANKWAIETLTGYVAKELGPRRIIANVVAPGAIETDFGNGRVRDNPEIKRQIAANTALGRVGLPDDVGLAVAALLSEGGRWINGQRIEVSGGRGCERRGVASSRHSFDNGSFRKNTLPFPSRDSAHAAAVRLGDATRDRQAES